MNKTESLLIQSFVNNITYLFLPYGEYSDDTVDEIVATGIEIAEEAYERVKHGSTKKSTREFEDEFKSKHPDIYNGDIYFYFGTCNYIGVQVGEETPEKIDKLLGGAWRKV